MAESTLSHLDYGHAGVATFDLDRREWLFARQFTTTRGPLKQVGIQNKLSIEAVPASIQFPNSTVSTRITDAKTNIKVLGRAHPQLVPASDLLPELAVTSAAVLSVTSNYDPLVGNLFSTGSVTYQTGSDKWGNPRRVAAMVAGEAGNILCLKLLFKETMGWGSDKSVWIKGNTLRDTDCGYWNEEAAAIQQVCFAQSEDRSTLLAVRLPTKTVIFRPFYSQDPQPTRPSPYYHLPSSLLDAHPILRLDIDQSGGSPHVDITFNPDFQLQFAVVDQNHVWSIWDIDHGRKGDEYKLSCLVQGYVASSVDTDLTGEDGWARILWVGDVNTILVCTRRQLSIVGINGGSFTYLSCPSLLTQRSSDWILDVKRHPLLRSRFFVLTSTQLYFMAVTTSSEALDANADVVGARVLLCWSHYRDAEDFTLSISVQMLDDDDLCVLLHSRLNNLTQNYTFRNSSLDSTLLSSPNPTLLDLATDGAGRIIQIHVEPCPFQGDTSANVSGLGRSYLAQGIQVYKTFMLQSDLSVHETILCARVFADGGLTENHEAVEAVSWTIAYRPRRDVRTIRDIKEMDNFIEAEEIEIKEPPTSKLLSQEPKWAESKTLGTAYRLIDHKFVYDMLIQRDSDKELTAENVEVPHVTTQLKQLLARNSDLMQLPLGTLLEFAGMKIQVLDVDEASSSLHDLLHGHDPDNANSVRRIASAHLLHLGEDDHPTISGLYDNLLQSWIAPLPPDIPLRVRQRKERLARRIAAEVMLASCRIRPREMLARVTESQPQFSQDSDILVPILPSQPLEGSPINSGQWTSSQPLPSSLLSQSQRPLSRLSPAYVLQSQSSQTLSSRTSDSADPLTRLSKHLKFREDSISQAIIPASVDQLLSHWKPGTDPRDYEWDAAERATRTEVIDEASQRESEKARKRRERRERRQQREDELMRAQPSSQPFMFTKPTAFPRSSPGPMLGGMGSSSQAPSQPLTQVPLPASSFRSQGGFDSLTALSQVEPGKFGGRPEKKKKKTRISGF